MSGDGHREVGLTRVELGVYEATNGRGGTLRVGTGDSDDFTPVELLLVALAGCTGADVDHITAKRAEPTDFTVSATGTKVRDESGNHLDDLEVVLTVRFPEGEAGDRAREMLPRAIAMSHDRLCTVSRTVTRGTPVTTREG